MVSLADDQLLGERVLACLLLTGFDAEDVAGVAGQEGTLAHVESGAEVVACGEFGDVTQHA